MTLTELLSRVSVEKIGYGTWRVYLHFSRGRYCTGITHDSLAIDRIYSDAPSRSSLYGYTMKQAFVALLSCVIRERVFVNPKLR